MINVPLDTTRKLAVVYSVHQDTLPCLITAVANAQRGFIGAQVKLAQLAAIMVSQLLLVEPRVVVMKATQALSALLYAPIMGKSVVVGCAPVRMVILALFVSVAIRMRT